jgi:hypothetical protein
MAPPAWCFPPVRKPSEDCPATIIYEEGKLKWIMDQWMKGSSSSVEVSDVKFINRLQHMARMVRNNGGQALNDESSKVRFQRFN